MGYNKWRKKRIRQVFPNRARDMSLLCKKKKKKKGKRDPLVDFCDGHVTHLMRNPHLQFFKRNK